MKTCATLFLMIVVSSGWSVATDENPTFEDTDRTNALRTMEEDMPWTIPFQVRRTCLQSDSPYTIRFMLKHGESSAMIDCLRPWRTSTWICMEEEEIENAMECAS